MESTLEPDGKAAIDADVWAGTPGGPICTNTKRPQRALVGHWLDRGVASEIVKAFVRWECEDLEGQGADK